MIASVDAVEGPWTWLDGTNLPTSSGGFFDPVWAYFTNFHKGKKGCLMMEPGMNSRDKEKYHISPCTYRRHYICEIPK